MAIESDLLACMNYAVNHQVPIINGYADVPNNIIKTLPKGRVIHGNALSSQWLQLVAEWHPHIVPTSAT